MRSINIRFLLLATIGIVLIAGTVHALHSYQYSKHSQSLKQRAAEAIERDDNQLAIDYLRRFVALERNDPHAFEQLGTLLVETGRPREAQVPLATALSLFNAPGAAEDVDRLSRLLAEIALKSRRWPDAEFQLTRLEGKYPDDAEIQEQLARCRMGQGKWTDAAQDLREAIELDPTRCSAYELLSDVEVSQLNSADSAVAVLQKLVDANPDAYQAHLIRGTFRLRHLTNPEFRVEVLQAEANQRSQAAGQPAESQVPPLTEDELRDLATQHSRRALELDPNDVAGLQLAMRCSHLYRNADPQVAEPALAAATEYAHRIIDWCTAKSAAEVQQIESQQSFQKSLPDGQADTKVGDGEPGTERAENAKRKLSENVVQRIQNAVFQQATQAYNVLADVAIRNDDPNTAIHVLNEGLQKVGFDESLLLNLASLKIPQVKDEAQAAEVSELITRLKSRLETEALGVFLEGRRDVVQGSLRQGVTTLSDVRSRLTNWPDLMLEADLLIGTCELTLGRPDLARDAYDRALISYPLSIPARWGLATTLEALNQQDEALQQYERVAARRSEMPDAPLFRELPTRVVRLLIGRNLGRPAEDPAWQPLLTYLRNERQKAGDDARLGGLLSILEAEVHFARQRPSEAEDVLKTAVEQNPQDAQLWVSLAVSQDYQSKSDESQATLSKARESLSNAAPGDHVLLQLAAAQHTVAVGGVEQARPMLKEMAAQAIADTPESDSERDARLRLLEGLGNLSRLVGEVATATQLYDQIRTEDQNKTHLRSRLLLFDLALQADVAAGLTDEQRTELRQKQLIRMEEILSDIGSIEGHGSLWNYGQAVYLTAKSVDSQTGDGDLEAALKCLNTAAAESPDWSSVPFLRGQILLRKGPENQTAATNSFLAAFNKGYRVPSFIAELVVMLYRAGRYAEAGEVLVKLKETQAPKLVELAQAAAAISTQLTDESDSTQLKSLALEYAKQTAEGSDDVSAHLAYGQIALLNADTVVAESEFQRARELAPEVPDVWLALIALYRRLDQPEKLQATLEAAQQVLGEAERGIVAGRTYEMLGERDQARTQFETALQNVPADLRQATARQIELLSRAAEFLIARPDPQSDEFTRGTAILKRLDDEGAVVLLEVREARRKTGARTRVSPEEAQLVAAVSSARRRLATFAMTVPGVENLEAALKLIQKNYEQQLATDADLRLEAMVLSRWPKREQRQQAIQKFRELIDKSSAPSDQDRLLLASLCLGERDSDQRQRQLKDSFAGAGELAAIEASALRSLEAARQQVEAIVFSGRHAVPQESGAESAKFDGTWLAAMTMYVEILLQYKEVPAARDAVDQLKQGAPPESTVVLETRVLFAEQKHADVVALLKQFADAAPAEQRPARLAAVSQILEGFGVQLAATPDVPESEQFDYFREVEAILQQVAERSDNDRLLLASFYARRKRTGDAMNIVEAVTATAAPAELASASAQVMANLGRDRPQMDRLDGILASARQLHPDSYALTLLQADLRAWRDDIPGAETLYREVLAEKPNHTVAANNLAYLLASQHKDMDEALQWIETAIKARGLMPDLLDTRAYVRLQRGEPQLAIQDLGVAITERPEAAFLLHLAQANLAVGQQAKAQEAWAMAKSSGLMEDRLHPAERAGYKETASQLD